MRMYKFCASAIARARRFVPDFDFYFGFAIGGALAALYAVHFGVAP